MPPSSSTKSTSDSTSTASSDRLASMQTSTFLNKPDTFIPYSTRYSQQARNRTSLPAPDISTDLIAKTGVDDFAQKHLGDRNSMIATYNNPSKQRTQYYEEQFQYKDNVNSNVRERVQRESPVVAELRTNVIIKDEFTLVTDLSYHLAARYTRPDSSVMVKVDHSACLALGGTFDPCYMLTITTVPAQMGPTMNKRNAALIQSFMADILSVPPERGIVKFEAVPEENYAMNGTTVLGEIERQEKQQANQGGNAVQRAFSNGRKSIPTFKKSLPKLDGETRADTKPESRVKILDPKETSMQKIGQSINGTSDGKKTAPGAAAAVPPTGVFELPAVEVDVKQPSTAQSHRQSTGSNGLRMNGVSGLDLSPPDSKTAPHGRPKTFSGGVLQEKIRVNGTPTTPARLSAVAPSKVERTPASLKPGNPTKQNPSSRPNSFQSKSSSVPPADGGKPAHVTGTSGNTQEKHSSSEAASLEQQPQELPSRTDMDGKKEPTANTAKRRSTITATPKMPAPPPIPETNDSKSTKSLKVGKRKSFLSAFRRSTAAN